MFYHVAILANSEGNFPHRFCETDKTSLDDINKYIIEPYLAEKKVYIDEIFIDYKNIKKLEIFESHKSASILADEEQSKVPDYIVGLYYNADCVLSDFYMKNITKSLLYK
ncbi:hypothetical protein [Acinetobacter bereziniae]|jgi:hypothetical protein|uniref:hypothetical protein n=1 Tax=Acinetobacter bereziniae TaxID=106648 RepID=UPI001250A921|nr:hypothetical protein [Acinetobacter bereziniae]MBO3654643.1 hypothetical protein [Acinetobacter bereziniae]